MFDLILTGAVIASLAYILALYYEWPFFEVVKEGYLHRWWLWPKNKYFCVYLHHFIGSDQDRHMHDHPWDSTSFLIAGKVSEFYETSSETGYFEMERWKPMHRTAEHRHIVSIEPPEAWTIFITWKKRRTWGFWIEGEFMHWEDYIRIDK